MEPYAAILTALALPADRLLRLQQLIVEREASAWDAKELSKDYRLGPENASIARAEAEAAFDQEITAVIGYPNDQKVWQMLSLSPQLADIQQTVGRDLGRIGAPLTADQTLQLAQVYKDVYAPPPVPSGASFDRTAGFDSAAGLSAADRQALARASALLTPEQLPVLQEHLSKLTTAYVQPGR